MYKRGVTPRDPGEGGHIKTLATSRVSKDDRETDLTPPFRGTFPSEGTKVKEFAA